MRIIMKIPFQYVFERNAVFSKRGAHTASGKIKWVEVFVHILVGPFFLPSNLTDEMYLQLLEDAIGLP